MFLKILPYFLFGITAFLTTTLYIFLRRFTKITTDKIVGITVALGSIPCCLAVLVMVFQVDSKPDWPWVIIAILPLIAYFLFLYGTKSLFFHNLNLLKKLKIIRNKIKSRRAKLSSTSRIG